MKSLFVLLGVFVLSMLSNKVFFRQFRFSLSGRIVMAVMLLFTAMGHFVFVEGMAMMLPDLIPYKRQVVCLTGFVEVGAAIGLLMPKLSRITAYCLMVFFVLVLPANIYAAVNHIDYERGTYDGSGLPYLWFRVPLQLFFVVWVYLSALKSQSKAALDEQKSTV